MRTRWCRRAAPAAPDRVRSISRIGTLTSARSPSTYTLRPAGRYSSVASIGSTPLDPDRRTKTPPGGRRRGNRRVPCAGITQIRYWRSVASIHPLSPIARAPAICLRRLIVVPAGGRTNFGATADVFRRRHRQKPSSGYYNPAPLSAASPTRPGKPGIRLRFRLDLQPIGKTRLAERRDSRGLREAATREYIYDIANWHMHCSPSSSYTRSRHGRRRWER